MRTLIWSVMMSIPFSYAWASADIPLVKGSQSPYHIVLDSNASPSEWHAAEELQSHFHACTGVELPIGDGSQVGDVPMIVLGTGPLAEGLGVAPSSEKRSPNMVASRQTPDQPPLNLCLRSVSR